VAVDPPPQPHLLRSFAFYAVVGTWMEADVIADTVRNAFAQGVERVYLVDNDSPDSTVPAAVDAGAQLAMTYRTDHFDDHYRFALMNALVQYVSGGQPDDHVWWLWLDADEFPRPTAEGTIREYLATLDEAIRVVGARFLNHYPTPGEVAFVPGRHPAAVQPLVEEADLNICALGHRKHPLQRWDRHGPPLRSGLGFHRAESAVRPLLEPREPIVIHHVPFREEETTRTRLRQLWSDSAGAASRAVLGDIATDHMEARWASLDAVYSGDWASVQNFLPNRPKYGVHLTDWRNLRPAVSTRLPTW
jgi:hypothetical protein